MRRSAHLPRQPSRGYARRGRRPIDRMTRVPPAQLSGEHSPARFRSFHDPALSVRRERTNLDGAIRGSRTARCPLEGGIERGKFEDGESAELFFGVGIGAVLDTLFSFLNSYGCAGFRDFQRIAADKDARLDESLVVGAPGAGIGVGSIAFPRRESVS